MQFVRKKPSRFRTARSISDLRGSNVDSEAPRPSKRRCRRTLTKLESQFASALHESITTKTGQKGTRRKTRKQKLYISLSSSVSKNLQDACSHRGQSGQSRSDVPRILLTPHSSQLAEKGPQRISRSSAGAACVRRLSSRSACEWQKS